MECEEFNQNESKEEIMAVQDTMDVLQGKWKIKVLSSICFYNKRNLGFIITALSLALQLRLNHLQITYYTLIILIFYGISQLI